jgi:HPt (histidine-containing phosphotransfer) domain-containing protein
LDRLGGNQALYARVLQSFLQEIASLPEQLEASLGSTDLTTAARLLHTLKGLSSTVGADHLAGVARQAELSVKAAKDANTPPDTATLLSELRAALSSTHSAMTQVATSFASEAAIAPAAPANAQEDVAKLRNLLALLEASDMAATEVYEELRASYADSDSADFQRLRVAMDELDFDKAAKACRALTS